MSKTTFQQQQSEVKQEQADMSYEDVKQLMQKKSEFVVELDNLQPQEHNWIDRGAKLTCEDAGHPYHEAWKRRRR